MNRFCCITKRLRHIRIINHIRLSKLRSALLWVLVVLLIFVSLRQKDDPPPSGPMSSMTELHQIMSKQYDVPFGVYDGAPFKKILYWDKTYSVLFNNENYGLGVGRDVYRKAGCPVWQCETSEDRSNLSQYDAIIFRYRNWNDSDLPANRLPHQRYIFFEYESAAWPMGDWPMPENRYVATRMNGFFNWTMTYRWDSDVVHPYGWIEPINSSAVPLHPNEEQVERLISEPVDINYAAGKTKMAAWFNSMCSSKSGREAVVEELTQNGIQVDVYGVCGTLNCHGVFGNRTDQSDEACRQMAADKYKFYLSLENSLCLDYITEKFYAMMRYPIIPIVMDAHGHHARTAPPHSYINILDFPTIDKLVDYLILLDRNDTLYNQYFWWKKHFRVRNSLMSGVYYRTFCGLCAALHDPSKHSNCRHRVYDDMASWWTEKSECLAALPYYGSFPYLKSIPRKKAGHVVSVKVNDE